MLPAPFREAIGHMDEFGPRAGFPRERDALALHNSVAASTPFPDCAPLPIGLGCAAMDATPADSAPIIPARDIRKFERTYAAGETVFEKGARGSSMFVVLEGSVHIRDVRDGETIEIAQRSAGEFFGEMALVDGGTRSAHAVAAETPTRLAEIDKARFMYLVSQQPAFSLAIIRELCRRIPMPDRS
jgi:hypothetical protein